MKSKIKCKLCRKWLFRNKDIYTHVNINIPNKSPSYPVYGCNWIKVCSNCYDSLSRMFYTKAGYRGTVEDSLIELVKYN